MSLPPLKPEDFFGPQPPVVMTERLRLEKKLHESGRVTDMTPLLKKPIVQMVHHYPKANAFFIDGEGLDKAKAIKLGKRVQRHLRGRRTLSYSEPYLHYSDLYVGYDGGTVKLPPLMTRASVKAPSHAVVAILDRVAEALERRGEQRLASIVDATANELLEQRDDMLEQTGFEGDVMRRDPDVADEIYEQPIPSIDLTTLYRRY